MSGKTIPIAEAKSGESSSSSSSGSGSETIFFETNTSNEEQDPIMKQHLSLLEKIPGHHGVSELTTTPIFTMPILKHAEAILEPNSPEPFPQYGLIGGVSKVLADMHTGTSFGNPDPRIFFNVATPSSTFICGSQGSGKSHTLSCLLENCLSVSKAGKLPKPLTGLVFHYDTFISDDGGSPCEAAFLSSDPKIKVRVLCSPTNIRTIQKTYKRFNIEVAPLQINESDLNTKRILELMAVKNDENVPLYVHTIYRILREMRLVQQFLGSKFNYEEFRSKLTESGLSPTQSGPLNQRLDALESFMPKAQTQPKKKGENAKKVSKVHENDWTSKPGYLTIVDLSCPCVTPETACSLFNICLSLFVEQSMDSGRAIALDEAHKFMNTSAEAMTLTDTLLSVIRLQRHLGARIIISTQEPTLSPALLDLCSVTIVHRFTSPGWMRILQRHLAGVVTDGSQTPIDAEDEENANESLYGIGNASMIFRKIVQLHVGESLVFAPVATVGLKKDAQGFLETERLGSGYLKIRVRNRLTTDGGQSVMAS